jgi:DNA-binding NarL/FixJ family response regulator
MRGQNPDALTGREREVLGLVRLGLTNEEIAGRLGITLDGAKYHVSQILSKLGVGDAGGGGGVAAGGAVGRLVGAVAAVGEDCRRGDDGWGGCGIGGVGLGCCDDRQHR